MATEFQRVNFSDDNPAPPSGMVPIHWQAADIPASWDTPRDFSGYVDPADVTALQKHGFGATLTADSPTVYFPASVFSGEITGWKMVTAKPDGSAVSANVKVWLKSSDVPTAGDSINTSGLSIVGAKRLSSATLTDFGANLSIAEGDSLAFHLESSPDPVTFSLEFS